MLMRIKKTSNFQEVQIRDKDGLTFTLKRVKVSKGVSRSSQIWRLGRGMTFTELGRA